MWLSGVGGASSPSSAHGLVPVPGGRSKAAMRPRAPTQACASRSTMCCTHCAPPRPIRARRLGVRSTRGVPLALGALSQSLLRIQCARDRRAFDSVLCSLRLRVSSRARYDGHLPARCRHRSVWVLVGWDGPWIDVKRRLTKSVRCPDAVARGQNEGTRAAGWLTGMIEMRLDPRWPLGWLTHHM